MKAPSRIGRHQTHAQSPVTRRIGVSPLTPVVGAEIEGVDLSEPIDQETFDELKAAFNAHGVLVFRDQTLDPEAHKAFARLWGRLHVHPYHAKDKAPAHAGVGAQRAASDPEILVVAANQSSRFVAGEGWHADVTCDEEPPFGSMLYIEEVPEIGGGDTCFLSTIRACEALSPHMLEICQGLTAVHDGAKPYSGSYGVAAPEGGWPRTTHPVIIRHPETGQASLYVNRGFTTRISQFSKTESDGFLELLWRHLETHPEFQCRVRWTPNTLVFWDNRVVQHHAVWDYYPYSRYGRRVSILGGRPAA